MKKLKQEGFWVRGVDIKQHEYAPSAADEFFDPAKAVRELGLPQTPPREALRKAVAWYRAHGYAP